MNKQRGECAFEIRAAHKHIFYIQYVPNTMNYIIVIMNNTQADDAIAYLCDVLKCDWKKLVRERDTIDGKGRSDE